MKPTKNQAGHQNAAARSKTDGNDPGLYGEQTEDHAHHASNPDKDDVRLFGWGFDKAEKGRGSLQVLWPAHQFQDVSPLDARVHQSGQLLPLAVILRR